MAGPVPDPNPPKPAPEKLAAPPEQCDAIICPQQYPPNKSIENAAIWQKKNWGPLLGSDMVHRRNMAGGKKFVSADPAHYPVFPKEHDLAGQPRYTWVEGPDGILYGTLTDEAKADIQPEPVGPVFHHTPPYDERVLTEEVLEEREAKGQGEWRPNPKEEPKPNA